MGQDKKDLPLPAEESGMSRRTANISHGLIVAGAECRRCLDPVQLIRLEQSFRRWAQDAARADVRLSRQRIFLIFLLIRYTGARLSEVLALDPFRDIDLNHCQVVFGKTGAGPDRHPRQVQIPESLVQELRTALTDGSFSGSPGKFFQVDPGHVRRKFYERVQACGFPKELGGPDALRRSRGVEMLQKNLPLPVVQRILGQSTPNLTAALVEFSEAEMQQVARFFLERESGRQTSARNSFFGKISAIQKGTIQARVELLTLAGDRLTAVITNDSLHRLGLKIGKLVVAEVKAPWVMLSKGEKEPECSAENRFPGTIARITRGRVTTEYVIQVAAGMQLCSLMSSDRSRSLDLQANEPVWAFFNCFAVILHLE